MRAWVRTYNYDNFNEWMPFITFNGTFCESLPMQTGFCFPAEREADVIAAMTQHGYVQQLNPRAAI